MRLILNVENDEKLQVFKALAKALKVKMSVEKKEHKVPNKRLLQAIKEIENGQSTRYNSVDEMMKDLESKSQAPLTQIIKDFKKDKKAGKVKIYRDFAEFEKDLEKI